MSQIKGPTRDLLINAVRAGASATEVVLHCQEWLLTQAKVLFNSERDVFSGANDEDVFDELQQRLIDKVESKGFPENSPQAIIGRLSGFIYNAARETKRSWLKRKKRLGNLQLDIEPEDNCEADDNCEGAGNYEQQMRLTFLRLCSESLKRQQRKLALALINGETQADIARSWGVTRQNVHNIYVRMTNNLAKCIEGKLREFQWTPSSDHS